MSEQENVTNTKEGGELSDKKRKKLEKSAAKDRRSEIRNVLLGNFSIDEQGRLCSGSGGWVTPFGFGDGAQQTIAFGVKHKTFLYRTKYKNNQQAVFNASKAMADIGRQLYLETAPDAAVCYVKSMFFRPVVLIFEERKLDDGSTRLELSAHCGRSPIAIIPVLRAVARFNKALPEEIVPFKREKK